MEMVAVPAMVNMSKIQSKASDKTKDRRDPRHLLAKSPLRGIQVIEQATVFKGEFSPSIVSREPRVNKYYLECSSCNEAVVKQRDLYSRNCQCFPFCYTHAWVLLNIKKKTIQIHGSNNS
jgi:hypothetical protein